jgi:hypothetical protein
MELKVPIGKKAYVMKLKSANPPTMIYVKLQITGNSVLGRSFHLEDVRQSGSGRVKGDFR